MQRIATCQCHAWTVPCCWKEHGTVQVSVASEVPAAKRRGCLIINHVRVALSMWHHIVCGSCGYSGATTKLWYKRAKLWHKWKACVNCCSWHFLHGRVVVMCGMKKKIISDVLYITIDIPWFWNNLWKQWHQLSWVCTMQTIWWPMLCDRQTIHGLFELGRLLTWGASAAASDVSRALIKWWRWQKTKEKNLCCIDAISVIKPSQSAIRICHPLK